MEIFGVGMPELVFILIIALIVLGPKDMQKAGKTIGKWLRSIVTSDGWKLFQQTSREIRTLPNRLMREANDELNQIGGSINSAIDSQPPVASKEPARSLSVPEGKIAPPVISEETKENENESEQEKDA